MQGKVWPDFLHSAGAGHIPGWFPVHKFGRNTNIGLGSMEDIWAPGGFIPWPTTGDFARVVSDNAGDTAAGAGAREITVQGLAAGTWALAEDTIATDGISTATGTVSFIRVFRAFVSKVGTYATTGVGSNLGVITIDRPSDSAVWALINTETHGGTDVYGMGQTQQCAYTVPAGHHATLMSMGIGLDSSKTATIFLWQRSNSDTITGDMGARRLVTVWDSAASPFQFNYPRQSFLPMTDIWASAIAGANGTPIEVMFDLMVHPADGVG